MKYMRQRLALLMTVLIAFAALPVNAQNVSGNRGSSFSSPGMSEGGSGTSVPGNIASSPNEQPQIITTTPDLDMADVVRVKYVPYSYTIRTDNQDSDNTVTYSIEEGTLARGLQIYPATGEIYGVPLEAGVFPITVKAAFSNPIYQPAYKELTLTVLDNTDGNVFSSSDPGYEVEQYIGTLVSGSYSVLTELSDQLFVSAGAYSEFIDLWLNGQKLIEGTDYTKEEGSTRITIRAQTFRDKADHNGVNTIAAEFRVGGDPRNALKRTAQNFRIELNGGGGSGDHSDSSPDAPQSPATSPMAVIRLFSPSGAHFSGLLIELHSTPMEATTDANGAAVFRNVEEGWHTLYIKDGTGNLLASKSFTLLFGEKEMISQDQITVKSGSAFTMNVQMDGDDLTFLSVAGNPGVQETASVQEAASAQETANVQEKESLWVRSANTGDSARFGLWSTLFVSAGALMGAFFWSERKRKISGGK